MQDNKKTIFVVGAGASSEVNMPVGTVLREQISGLLNFGLTGNRIVNGDPKMKAVFTAISPGTESMQGGPFHIAGMLRDALIVSRSIDNLLDAHRGNLVAVKIGKAAICRAILLAEDRSLLQTRRGSTKFSTKILADTWYVKLLHFLVEGCSFDELSKRFELVEIVTFNYDRTIEHFLLKALSVYYDAPVDKVVDLITKLKIVHPYGMVGTLPFRKDVNPVEFGGDLDGAELLRVSESIVTFSEGAIQNHDIGWNSAGRIVFLGFAFHRINMKLLFSKTLMPPPDVSREPTRVFGTTLGISPSDKRAIEGALRETFGSRASIEFFDGKCTDCLDAYRRSLEFLD